MNSYVSFVLYFSGVRTYVASKTCKRFIGVRGYVVWYQLKTTQNYFYALKPAMQPAIMDLFSSMSGYFVGQRHQLEQSLPFSPPSATATMHEPHDARGDVRCLPCREIRWARREIRPSPTTHCPVCCQRHQGAELALWH